MTGSRNTIIKFGTFAVVMALLTGLLFATFAQVRTGSTADYSAVFKDASRLASGDTVRVAGIRVGTVKDVKLLADRKIQVDFDADKNVKLTTGTTAAIRYLNLVGDRYLELVDAPGSTKLLGQGAQIPLERTMPALDLDLLLGGLKPVLQGLNPKDVNALTSSLVQIFQGQGDNLSSLMSKTSSFSNALADNSQVVEQLIDNLNTVVATLGDNGKEFEGAVDKFEKLVSGFKQDSDPIATAITSLDNGTASLADLLTQARPPLSGSIDQLNRLAPLLVEGKDKLDFAIQKMPNNGKKLARLGAYGSFIQYYMCGITLRVTDLQGRTAVFPTMKQQTGRCAEPRA
jgi:phospholipid/cholesterol/gamma-HCH transport system substrate-binding protein